MLLPIDWAPRTYETASSNLDGCPADTPDDELLDIDFLRSFFSAGSPSPAAAAVATVAAAAAAARGAGAAVALSAGAAAAADAAALASASAAASAAAAASQNSFLGVGISSSVSYGRGTASLSASHGEDRWTALSPFSPPFPPFSPVSPFAPRDLSFSAIGDAPPPPRSPFPPIYTPRSPHLRPTSAVPPLTPPPAASSRHTPFSNGPSPQSPRAFSALPVLARATSLGSAMAANVSNYFFRASTPAATVLSAAAASGAAAPPAASPPSAGRRAATATAPSPRMKTAVSPQDGAAATYVRNARSNNAAAAAAAAADVPAGRSSVPGPRPLQETPSQVRGLSPRLGMGAMMGALGDLGIEVDTEEVLEGKGEEAEEEESWAASATLQAELRAVVGADGPCAIARQDWSRTPVSPAPTPRGGASECAQQTPRSAQEARMQLLQAQLELLETNKAVSALKCARHVVQMPGHSARYSSCAGTAGGGDGENSGSGSATGSGSGGSSSATSPRFGGASGSAQADSPRSEGSFSFGEMMSPRAHDAQHAGELELEQQQQQHRHHHHQQQQQGEDREEGDEVFYLHSPSLPSSPCQQQARHLPERLGGSLQERATTGGIGINSSSSSSSSSCGSKSVNSRRSGGGSGTGSRQRCHVSSPHHVRPRHPGWGFLRPLGFPST
ncbi:unnamed protein product [Closterium sp. NIES-54]